MQEAPMSDNMQNRGPQDRSRISLGQEHEVRYWTRELGVSDAELKMAVAMAGSSADDVRKFLRRR
jgi:hypothetical protein